MPNMSLEKKHEKRDAINALKAVMKCDNLCGATSVYAFVHSDPDCTRPSVSQMVNDNTKLETLLDVACGSSYAYCKDCFYKLRNVRKP